MHRLLALVAFTVSMGYSASPRAVAPRKYRAPAQEKLQRALRLALPSLNHALPPLAPHRLPEVDNARLLNNANKNGRVQVGIHRTVVPQAMQSARRDGRVWRLAIQSPGANAVRLHFTGFDVGGGRVWIHDGSGDEQQIFGPYTGRGVHGDGDFWSDIVFSETVTIEYQPGEGESPGIEPPFAISELSHQFSTLAAPGEDKSAAASCELDVNCYSDWAANATGVARISFEEPDGTYVCSGTLINTRNNSNVPYFLTANHCIDSDTVAKTLQAVWLFQKDRCNGSLPSRNFPRSLGATLMATGDRTQGDFTLLKLSSIPDGVTFQGWDPAEQAVGTPVTVIHHPAGDYKRIAFGNVVINSRTPQNFYSVFYSAGLTEGGSSGSGIFSAPGVLVGTLSNGPKADTVEGYCQLIPFADNYGKFSGYYPLLRDILEERGVGGPPAPPLPSSSTLTSGVATPFNLGPVTGGTLFNGGRGFTIAVPDGATRLDIVVRTTTPGADVDLFARFGQDVTINAGSAVADHASATDGGNEQVTVTAAGTPPLRAGTYYIALGLFTANMAVTGTITATVTAGNASPPSGGGTMLTSATAATFNIGPVTGGTLFNGSRGFTIIVPQGATRLDVVVRTATPGADVDLFLRFDQDVTINAGSPVADQVSATDSGNEQVALTSAGSPPLRAGTYYIALGLFTTNMAVTGTVTATVTMGSSTPPPSGGVTVLTSGAPSTFTLPSVTGGTLFNGNRGFTITVPQGAGRLDVRLSSSTPGADLDLFVRFGSDPAVQSGSVLADYSSESPTADESVSVSASSSPPLRAGTYYIAVAAFTPGVSINATITATVTTGAATPSPGGTVLTSGRPQNFSLGPVTGGTLFRGPASYTIVVPQGAASLDIVLHTATPNADLDLFARFNQDTALANGSVAADYSSTGSTGEEHITITANSSPPLRAGAYYISLALFTPNVTATGTLTATVNTTAPPPPASGPALLFSGMRQMFSFNAVSSPTLFNGTRSYAIDVPANATRLDVTLDTATPGADLDLYVSFGKDNSIGSGSVVADFASEGPDGNERITITPGSAPSLQPGRYYISLAVFTTGTSITGSVLATISSGGSQSTAPTTPTVLSFGTPAKFSLPASARPTLFTGNYSFQVQVPAGSTSMRVQVISDNSAVDVDLYCRYGSDNSVDDGGNVIADYASEGPTGNETLSVSTASSPPLRPGLYYFSLALFTRNTPSSGMIVVTVDRGAIAPPTTSGTPLTSGVPANYSLPAVSSPTLFTGANAYRITVGSQHTALRVSVRNNPPGTDVDLFMRLGQEPAVANGRVAADFSSATDGGNEDLVVQGAGLQPGVYYIALALYSTNVPATGTIVATLSSTGGSSTQLELTPVSDATIDPKPAADVRQPLPDTKSELAGDDFLAKHPSVLKKREPLWEIGY